MINVLIVDDDAIVAELNRVCVSQVPGFTCSSHAATPHQAEEMINNPALHIDLILLDIYLQKDNGLDLLPILRSAVAAIDVIVISSASDVTSVQKSRHYGVVGCLLKPPPVSAFRRGINQLAGEKETD
ncbi:DNA-binding transcriptional activator DcuR [Erwinia tracheiphila PSU-1]|nr:DNA-binding transcriptional activator DcuR [Erwinia tracheiphila PSU-1]